MESKFNDKFGNSTCQVSELKVVEAIKRKKYFLKFENKIDGSPMCVTGAKRLGMLCDFLEIPKLEFRKMIENSDIEGINSLLEKCDKTIRIIGNFYQGNYWVFNFASEKFTIIKFSEIRTELQDYFGLEFSEFNESKFNSVMVWEKEFRAISVCSDKIDIILRITSGNNVKDSAAKIIVYGRVKSCENSIQAMSYVRIKHFVGWKEKLINSLDEAIDVVKAMRKTIKLGAEKSITLEEGNQIIDNIKFKLRDEDKINRVKTALKTRFAHEFKTNQNRFGLSQAMSYIGTHTNPQYSSDETLSILQQQAYEVFQ
jgi:hypothetical protein